MEKTLLFVILCIVASLSWYSSKDDTDLSKTISSEISKAMKDKP